MSVDWGIWRWGCESQQAAGGCDCDLRHGGSKFYPALIEAGLTGEKLILLTAIARRS